MREHAEDLFSTGDQMAGDPFAAETLGRHLIRRIAELARAELDESICVQGAPGTGNPNPGN